MITTTPDVQMALVVRHGAVRTARQLWVGLVLHLSWDALMASLLSSSSYKERDDVGGRGRLCEYLLPCLVENGQQSQYDGIGSGMIARLRTLG